MTRKEKYPETDVFHYFNANPHNRMGVDCVVRATCTFIGIPWEQALRELTETGIKKGRVFNDDVTYALYFEKRGLHKMPQPRKADNTKYTAGEFCRLIADKDKRYFLNMAGHCVAVVDGKLQDIWDCSEKSVGNYWVI